MKCIDIFFERLDKALLTEKGLSKFSVDGVDFLYEHYDEIENEAPITNEFLQTGNMIDDLDGYDYGLCSEEHFAAVRKIRDEAMTIYKEEQLRRD
ncbi:MAG: hypothetical protein ACK5MW_09300 [Enterococcus sp.]